MVHIKFSLSKSDFVTFHEYQYWKSPQQRSKRIKQMLRYFITNLIIIGIITYTAWFSFGSTSYFIFVGVLVLGMIMQFFTSKQKIKAHAEKLADNIENIALFAERQMHFSSAEIIVTDEYIESKIQWKAIIRLEETPQYYYLYITSNQSLIIPKSVLTLSGNMDEFKTLLTQNISLHAEAANYL
ncbi:MAG: hypothetical protein RLY16_2806 [Bacteroidota bacterium]|jgi:c-di-AMP phosphodiesterase-like protein